MTGIKHQNSSLAKHRAEGLRAVREEEREDKENDHIIKLVLITSL